MSCEALKDGSDLPAFADHLADEDRSLRRKIAQLDTTTREHRNRVLVEFVVWLGAELNRLTGGTNLNIEAAGGAALVRVVDPNDGE